MVNSQATFTAQHSSVCYCIRVCTKFVEPFQAQLGSLYIVLGETEYSNGKSVYTFFYRGQKMKNDPKMTLNVCLRSRLSDLFILLFWEKENQTTVHVQVSYPVPVCVFLFCFYSRKLCVDGGREEIQYISLAEQNFCIDPGCGFSSRLIHNLPLSLNLLPSRIWSPFSPPLLLPYSTLSLGPPWVSGPIQSSHHTSHMSSCHLPTGAASHTSSRSFVTAIRQSSSGLILLLLSCR